MEGIVKRVFERGFGWVALPDGRELYFHVSNVIRFAPAYRNQPVVGDRVAFEIGKTKGKDEAKNVRIVSSEIGDFENDGQYCEWGLTLPLGPSVQRYVRVLRPDGSLLHLDQGQVLTDGWDGLVAGEQFHVLYRVSSRVMSNGNTVYYAKRGRFFPISQPSDEDLFLQAIDSDIVDKDAEEAKP